MAMGPSNAGTSRLSRRLIRRAWVRLRVIGCCTGLGDDVRAPGVAMGALFTLPAISASHITKPNLIIFGQPKVLRAAGKERSHIPSYPLPSQHHPDSSSATGGI